MKPDYIPAGHNAVSPYLLARDGVALVAFLEQVFLAEVLTRLEAPDGSLRHAALAVADSVIMVGTRRTATSNSTHVYVPDVDETYHRGLACGAVSIREPTDFSYGDRSAAFEDPFGNLWWLGTHQPFLG